MRFSDRIIPISESTAKNISKYLPYTKGKINMIYHGADKPKNKLLNQIRSDIHYKDYFVYTGRLDSYGKNLINTLKAYNQYIKEGGKNSFFLIGAEWRNTEKIKEYIRENNLSQHVKVMGFLEEHEKNNLIKNSSGMIFVSLHEGFGHPILECFAFRKQILTSNISSMPEIGGSAPIYVDPYSVPHIKDGLHKLENFNYDEDFYTKINFQLNKFSWKKMYKMYTDIFIENL